MKTKKKTAIDFTDDFLAMAASGSAGNRDGLRRALRDYKGTDAARGEAMQRILIEELAPIMVRMPPIVQQIVGRTFVEGVDWERLAAAICTNPEDN